MATALDKSKQLDMAGLALIATDADLSGDLTVGDDLTVTGDLAVTGTITTAAQVMTPAAGITTDAEAYGSSITRAGDLITTTIVIDLTDLVGSTTDLDIIGKSAVASHIGRVTTALNGVIKAGKVTCLEVPTGGADDLDFYSATVATGAENVDVTTLTETVLITSGAAWASGTTKGMTTVPPPNDYIYIVNGEASVPGTFTAGKFVIELYGQAA